MFSSLKSSIPRYDKDCNRHRQFSQVGISERSAVREQSSLLELLFMWVNSDYSIERQSSIVSSGHLNDSTNNFL